MKVELSKNRVRKNLETYYQQRAARLRILNLKDIFPSDSAIFWFPTSASAPEIVTRLIEHHLALFETEWRQQIQNADFCLNAIRAKKQVDERFAYDAEMAHAHNRLTLAFINEYCKPDYSIDWSKLLRFNSGAD